MVFKGISMKKVVTFTVTCNFVYYSACHFPRLVREELHDHKRLTLISSHMNSFSKAILPLYPTLRWDSSYIIESVDSICRDSADTQYMLIQTNFSKSPEQLTYTPL